MATCPSVLVTDFDGTMTRRDFYRVSLARLAPPGTHDYWEDYLAGRLTHFKALQARSESFRSFERWSEIAGMLLR